MSKRPQITRAAVAKSLFSFCIALYTVWIARCALIDLAESKENDNTTHRIGVIMMVVVWIATLGCLVDAC